MGSSTTNNNFEYPLLLAKVLSAQSRASRRETEQIEQLLQKIATKSSISFTEYCKTPVSSSKTATTQNTLVDENYKLVYEIEEQEYSYNNIWSLITTIDEHMANVKSFVMEKQRTTLAKDEDISNLATAVQQNLNTLQETKVASTHNLDMLVSQLQHVLQELDWSRIDKSSPFFTSLLQNLQTLEKQCNTKIIPPIINH